MMAGRVRKSGIDSALAVIEVHKNDKGFERALQDLSKALENSKEARDSANLTIVNAGEALKKLEVKEIAEAAKVVKEKVASEELRNTVAYETTVLNTAKQNFEIAKRNFEADMTEKKSKLLVGQETLNGREAASNVKREGLNEREERLNQREEKLRVKEADAARKADLATEFANRFKG